MGHLSQGVRLVHELAQCVGAEEAVHHAADGLGIDEFRRREDLVVTHVHALADGTGHTSQTDGKLVAQLLTYGTHAAVGHVVDVIHIGLAVHQLDEILDNLDDILLRQDTYGGVRVEVQLAVQAVTTHIAQVITLLAEEEVQDDLTCTCLISRLSVAQQTVDELDGIILRVGSILLQGVEDDAVVRTVGVVLVNENALDTAVENLFDIVLGEHRFTVQYDLVALDADHLTGILIHEVLGPGAEHAGCQRAAQMLSEVLLADFHVLCEVEDVEDVSVILETDGSQQSGDGQLLLTVDVGIHHVVDVRGKLNPATLEGDDTGRVELRTVGMDTAAEEDTGGTVKL